MKEKILIVEDQFVEADYLRMMLVEAGYTVTGIARTLQQAEEMVARDKPSMVLLDIFLKGKGTGIDLARQLTETDIPFVYLSANSNEEVLTQAKATQPYGFLVKPFREKDLLVTLEVARYRHEHSRATRWRLEMQLQQMIQKIQAGIGDWTYKMVEMTKALQAFIPFDCLVIKFQYPTASRYSGMAFLRIGFEEYQVIGIDELSVMTGISFDEIKKLLESTPPDTHAGCYVGEELRAMFDQHPMKKLMAKTFGFSSNLVLPLIAADGFSFSFSFFRRAEDGFQPEQIEWLYRLQQPLTNLVNSISVADKKEALYMRYDPAVPEKAVKPRTKWQSNGIIGTSPALLNIMDQISQVAPLDTSVLVLGESGTGKERIADCIHQLSLRKDRPFVKVNCAALPATLIESELFGHEKGAFTGATDKRIGKFMQANTGTIFLDEIGDMPLELQVKLLRVLQEKEIEILGGKEPAKIDVRIIAATNRNLEKEVAEGKFRLDLYYRLNVFPLTLPALRDRKEDLEQLTAHFIEIYNRKAGKKIKGCSEQVFNKMLGYSWPGNIRELENLIERSVLMAKGNVIEEMAFPVNLSPTEHNHIKTIHENERDHIIDVLQRCNGRIWGPGAAAEILNLAPSTLRSRMIKLGIKKHFSK
jgi:DNA-binding NtrC family response regulator